MGGAQSSANCALPVDEMDTRPALRFLTCGSVDDGKSTLIGRLLYEQHLIFDDHLSALERDRRSTARLTVVWTSRCCSMA